jgi:hypothetical protein
MSRTPPEGKAMSPIEVWRRVIIDACKSWVLFENGTCVVLAEPEEDLAAQAVVLMKEWGPVHAGSPAGDFGVIELPDGLGWAVTGHHDDIQALVGPDEVSPEGADDMVIGMLGRSKRHEDSEGLVVIHVEDRRSAP